MENTHKDRGEESCRLYSEREAASFLSVSGRTLQGWRYSGEGPLYARFSRRCIRYRLGDLNEFVNQRIRQSTSGDAL